MDGFIIISGSTTAEIQANGDSADGLVDVSLE
jgi:hypothetical protein